jgi:hypothetical protein
VRHRSIGAWGRKWQCSPRRRGLLWRFGAKSMVTAVLRPPELGKRTLRRGGAARGSFLWPEVVVRGGIEGGGWLGSFFAPEQRRKGREKGSGASLGVPRREEEEETEGGLVHVVLMLGQPAERGHSGDDHCRVV